MKLLLQKIAALLRRHFCNRQPPLQQGEFQRRDDGARYFGLMEIHSRKSSEDYCWVLGLRNSHDKTFPAGIVAVASVFVCDNLSFLGEVKFSRQHTVHINRDLPQLVERSIGAGVKVFL